MALSDAYKYATGEGGIGLDAFYNNINQFLATNPDQQAVSSAMAQYGVSQEDVDAARALVKPVTSGLSAVTGGKNTVLEDTSNVVDGGTGALTQATNGLTTGATTGALTQASGLTNQNANVVNQVEDTGSLLNKTGALTQASGTTDQTTNQGGLTQANSTANAVDNLAKQILASSNTSVWQGEGFGSAEANAKDMAKILAGIDITDLSQFGKITKTGVDAAVMPDGNGGFVDANGKAVDPSLVRSETVNDESGEYKIYMAPVGTQEGYGNKVTGQFVPNTYGERQTDNAWGGTYAGKGNTAYRVQLDAQGKPLFYTTGASSSDIGQIAPLLAIASFIPGVAPFAMAAQAAIAIDQGDIIGGLASLAGLGGFTDAATGLRIAKAVSTGDASGLITALMQNPTVSNAAGSTMLTDTISLRDASNALNVANNVSNGNYAGALSAAGMLTGSKDIATAGAALRLVNAINSGNETAIINALGGLNNTINAANNLSNKDVASNLANNVSKTAPLSDDEIADLTPDQLNAYQSGGTQGLIDYNRAIKNMSGLTTSGLTGDAMGGNDTLSTTGGTTGDTRSLSGTGGLSAASTTDDFENLMITGLRAQGLNNSQISAYLDDLNNKSSGLNDVGLLAFRQAKLSGATDAEAFRAANLASGKTDVTESETETEAELTVTDTNTDTEFETNIYSFYDTQRETGSELIVTSGRETGQETESETFTGTELIVTSGRETETDTFTGTEVVVTTSSETHTPTETETEIIVTTASETQSETETQTEIIVTTSSETLSESQTETEIVVTTASETQTETETEIVVTTASETKTETETEIVVTTASETVSETETQTEIVVTTSSETVSETETETEIVVTTASETETETVSETETESVTEIVVTTASETHTPTETETEITVTATRTETETQTETGTRIPTFVATKPTTTSTPSFTVGTPATGSTGKPIDFLKENLLKTYMTKDSFKDPLAEFTKARTNMMKENMMQQGVDPRLAAILAAKMNGTEPPPAPTYIYGEEPSSIDEILGLKGEGDQYFAQGGYVQPLMAQGGMALPLLAAKGGLPTMHKGREDFRDGKHVAGEGDGQSDDIPAMLADGEFVFPADVVSALGNGSTKAGTDKLYEMMHSIRDRARSKGPKDLPPPALKSPLDYLKKR